MSLISEPERAVPLTRRELRELEREAQLQAQLAERDAAVSVPVEPAVTVEDDELSENSPQSDAFMSRRERREAERMRLAQQAERVEVSASVAVEASTVAAPAVEVAAPQAEPVVDAPDETAGDEENPTAAKAPALALVESVVESSPVETPESSAAPEFLSRRERREAERAAVAQAAAQLEAEAMRAAASAVDSNPELFAKPALVEDIPVAEVVDTAIVDTLDDSDEPIVLAPVVSLDEVRAARAEAAEVVPAAPSNEPEVEVPDAFRSREEERGERVSRSNRTASSVGRVSGSMVALSFLAGTVVLGAGSAAALSAFGSQNETDASSADIAAADVQSLSVGDAASAAAGTRSEEVTAVTSIGTAAAANLATGVELPDSKAYTNDLLANVQWPFPMGVEISSDYGHRHAPTAGASSFHGGVDFTPGIGTPIGSIADGVVTKIDEAGGSATGIYVEVQHVIEGELVTTVYGHMKPGSVVVDEGQKVAVGDELGDVGNTGVSTGPHLHFEVHIQGKLVDPYYFLTKMNVSGVKVELPTTFGPDVAVGTNEKMDATASHAFVDEVFQQID